MANLDEKIIIEVDLQDGEAPKNLKEIRKEMNETKNSLTTLTKGTDEYREALTRTIELQGQISDINEDLRMSQIDFGQQMQQTLQITNGVIGGFNSLNATMKLLTGDNEALNETFVQLQASMALVQGIQALTTGIGGARKAFQAFNATVRANPLMLIVTAIALVIAGIKALAPWLNKQNKQLQELNESQTAYAEAIELSNSANDHELNLMRAKGASQSELLKQQQKFTDITIQQTEQRIDALREELAVAQARTTIFGRIFGTGNAAVAKELKKQIDELEKTLQGYRDKRKQLDLDLEVEMVREAKKASDERIANTKREVDEKLKEEERYLNIIKNNEKTLRDLRQARAEEIAEREFEAKWTDDLIGKMDALNGIYSANALQINYLNEQLKDNNITNEERVRITEELIELQKEQYQIEDAISKTNEEQFKKESDEKLKAHEAYLKQIDDEIKAKKEQAKIEAEIRERQIEGAWQMTDDLILAFGEQSAVGKALAIAQTTMATYEAAMQAYKAMAGIPVVGPGLGIAAAAAAIAAGVANVKKILEVKILGDTASTSTSISMPSMPEVSSPITPVYAEIAGSSIDEINTKPQRVYVLESDITNAQRKVRVTESNATF